MRFRKPGRALGAVLFLPVLAMLTTAVPAQAAPNPTPVPMTRASTSDFSLQWSDDRRTPARNLVRAVNRNGNRVRVGTMLNAANLQAHTQANMNCRDNATGPAGALRGVSTSRFYCLTHEDATTTRWTPQGISGTEDAQPGRGTVDQRRAIVFSWHAGPVGGSGTGTRLSFLVPSTNRYIHVLLVRPNDAGTDYGNVSLHAGGIAWYSHYLFVTAGDGVHVFDTNNLLRLAGNPKGNTTDENHIGLQPDGKYYGRGYGYLLPEIGRWHNPNATTVYDSISLERAPGRDPQFVTGEYRDTAIGRVARWRDDDLTRFSGTIRPFIAWFEPVRYVQGAFSRGCYYFTTGGGGSGNRHLVVANTRGNRTPVSYLGGRGLQDLYWLRSADQLWTLTEHPGDGMRVLYGVPRPPCP
ncbi:hypothetical protein [Streptomyces sp. GC420]|uniref:hypothetical protein n=1 Tax=Streptomyces sp. GC420 TaxID=2697568 RepID=UPI001414FD95|nr:hypothetical protein [Streptomyces sp. GC420]NBM16030.1 hypothetical protein [Streptomyces sp. GC420]